MESKKILGILVIAVIAITVAVTGGVYYVKNVNPDPIPTTKPQDFIVETPKSTIKKDDPDTLIGKTTGEITEALGAPAESTASVQLNKAIWVYVTNEISKDAIYVYFHDADVINVKQDRFEGDFSNETWLLTPYFPK